MSRKYTYAIIAESVSVAVDFFEVTAAANKVLKVHSLVISQSSDAGDSEDEQLPLVVHRGSGGSGGNSSVTPTKHDNGDAAIGGSAETLNTTQAAVSGELLADSFNVRAGYQYFWPPEDMPVIPGGGSVVVRLGSAPADALTMSASLTVEEIG